MKLRQMSVVVVLIPLVLTGCRDHSRDDTAAPLDHGVKTVKITDQYRGLGRLLNGRTDLTDAKPSIYRLDATGQGVALTTYGSGSCPGIPVKLQVVSPTRVKLTLKDYRGACTADLGAYTTEFILPSQVSRKQAVLFTLQTPRVSAVERVVLQPEPLATTSPTTSPG